MPRYFLSLGLGFGLSLVVYSVLFVLQSTVQYGIATQNMDASWWGRRMGRKIRFLPISWAPVSSAWVQPPASLVVHALPSNAGNIAC